MEYNKYQDIEIFEEGLKSFNILLSDIQKQQFIDYYELLLEWNKVMNLTSITDFKEVMQKHFIDSLSLVKVLYPKNEIVLDVGTGAGFPGIPLKIAFPDIKVVLLDSLNKRINFLNEVINKLELGGITAIHGRAEDFAHQREYREVFDLCVSRAVAKLSVLCEYCLPFIKVGGCFVPYKSGQVEDEIMISSKAIQLLGGEIKSQCNFTLPSTDMERSLIVIYKNKLTQKKYPRSAGKPTKEPL